MSFSSHFIAGVLGSSQKILRRNSLSPPPAAREGNFYTNIKEFLFKYLSTPAQRNRLPSFPNPTAL